MNATLYSRWGKRILDVTAALVGLLLVSPVLVLAAIAVKVSGKGHVFFKQARSGLHGVPFQIVKFRTMHPATDGNAPLVTASGDRRITVVGRWLRKSKIDELPQLFNVLRGEMSLVGPRPEVPLYTHSYSEEQKKTLSVRPGITGPAAIAYRQEEELLGQQADKDKFYREVLLPAKLEIDLDYCNNLSLARDLHLVLQTATCLVSRRRDTPVAINPTGGSTISAAKTVSCDYPPQPQYGIQQPVKLEWKNPQSSE
jgi:lipopolysaccharide/colanic/teichoic acid biosynthesis glycosyltransferase